MTIVEAVKRVLTEKGCSLTAEQIYSTIIEENLYCFLAKKPLNVLKWEIRRHCMNLEFKTSDSNRPFILTGYLEKEPLYNLVGAEVYLEEKENFVDRSNTTITPKSIQKELDNQNEMFSEYSIPVIKKEIEVQNQSDNEELSPEEKLELAYQQYNVAVKKRLVKSIIQSTSSFFKYFLINLLTVMGYRNGEADGIRVRRGPGGILNCILSQGQLGKELIFVQARKCPEDNIIGLDEMKKYVDAMEEMNKGIYITTSSFSMDAKKYVNSLRKKDICLIDGDILAQQMIHHGVGIKVIKRVSIYNLDQDYFI